MDSKEQDEVPRAFSTDYLANRGAGRAIDLYWCWFDKTHYRVLVPTGAGQFPSRLTFIAEGDPQKFRQALKNAGQKYASAVDIPRAYLQQVENPAPVAAHESADSNQAPTPCATDGKFFTYSVLVPKDTSDVTKADLTALATLLQTIDGFDKALTRVQLGFDRGADAMRRSERKPTGDHRHFAEVLAAAGCSEIPALVDRGNKCTGFSVAAKDREVAEVVLGVVDDGAAFAHDALRGPGGCQSRVRLVWNQSIEAPGAGSGVDSTRLVDDRFWCTSTTESGWYGAVLTDYGIQMALVHAALDPIEGELVAYDIIRRHRFPGTGIASRFSHGAAVLTTLAGSVDALAAAGVAGEATSGYQRRCLDDSASKAPIIFVDLPAEKVAISSGRWMPVALLDGITFICEMARRKFVSPCKKPVPIVISVSSGSNTGPRDGGGVLDAAIASLLKADPNLAIVVAAGNLRLSGTHCDEQVPAKGTTKIVVRVPARKPAETYIELWPTAGGASNLTAAELLAGLTFTVTAPDRRVRVVTGQSGYAEAFFEEQGGKQDVAGVFLTARPVQSPMRPMVLLVVAATAPHEHRPHAPGGDWEITVKNKLDVPVRIESWIERDEVIFGHRRPQAAHFVDDRSPWLDTMDWDDATGSTISRMKTMNNLAVIPGVFSVAAGTGGYASGYVSTYSGAGSFAFGRTESELQRPSFAARADRNPAAIGVPVLGAYASSRWHMSGTSIATPQAARWVANMFATGHYDRYAIQAFVADAEPRAHPHLHGKIAASEGRLYVSAAIGPVCGAAIGYLCPH